MQAGGLFFASRRCLSGTVFLFHYGLLLIIMHSSAVSLALAGEETTARTLFEIVRKAQESNLALKQQQSVLRGAEAEISIAKAALLPDVFLETATGVFSRSENFSVRAAENRRSGSYDEVRLSLQQTLLDGSEAHLLISAGKARHAAEKSRLRQFEQTLFMNLVKAYANLRFARAVLRHAKSDLRFAKRQTAMEKERFALGEATLTHLSLTRGYQHKAEIAFHAALSKLKSAETGFVKHGGVDPGAELSVNSIGHRLPKTLAEARRTALENHPLFSAGKMLIEEAELLTKREKAARLPRLYMDGHFSRGGNAQSLLENVSSIGLRLKMPLFNEVAVRGKVSRREETRLQLQLEYDQQVAQVLEAVDSVYAAHEAAGHSQKAAKAAVRRVNEAFSLALQERDHELKSTPQMLEVHRVLSDAILQSFDVERSVMISQFGLLYAIGSLDLKLLEPSAEKHVSSHADLEEGVGKDQWSGLRKVRVWP